MALNNEVSVLNLENINNDIKDASTRGMIAAEEKMEYATRNYDVNEYFIWNDRKLYKTKQQIGVGANFVIDGNIKYVGSVTALVNELEHKTEKEVDTRVNISSHNLIPFPNDVGINPINRFNITVIENTDGSLVVNGIATGSSVDVTITRRMPMPNFVTEYYPFNDYVFCLLDENDNIITSEDFTIYAGVTYNSQFVEIGTETSGGVYEFTIDSNTNCDYKLDDGACMIGLYIRVSQGASFSNKLVKPLLKIKTDLSFKYAQPAPSNNRLDTKIRDLEGMLQKTLAIVAEGDNHTQINNKEFVYVKNNTHNLDDGLYRNSSGLPIAANAALSSNNLTPVTLGGFNSCVLPYEDAVVTLSNEQYGGMYYANVTITGSADDVVSCYILSTTSNRPAYVTRIGDSFRAWGTVAGTVVGIRFFFQ